MDCKLERRASSAAEFECLASKQRLAARQAFSLPSIMSKSLEAHVRSLDDELEQLNAIQDKTDALLFFYDALPGRQAEQSHEGTESGKDQTRESDRSWASLLVNVVKKHKLGHVFFDWVSRRMDSETTTEVTLRFMPCANLDALKDGTCRRKGEKVCSGCKLVAYCSSVSFFCCNASAFY